MKRKPLSMKKLYEYSIEYLVERSFILDIDTAEYEQLVIVKFLDYIMKNPK